MKPDLLVVWPNRPHQMALLEAAYTVHLLDEAADPEAMIAKVAPRCEAVITTGGKGLARDLIEKLPGLKVVASSGVGYDTIDVDACTEHGIKVTNTPDVLTGDVADMGLLLMLAARRKLIVGDKYVRSSEWGSKGKMPLTTTMRGKKLGIAGLGRIGKALALRAEPLRLEIAYTGHSAKPGVSYEFITDLQDLAQWSDILVVAVTGGSETRVLISAPVISALGPAATLINIARGSVVDEPALLEALQSGALDNVVLYPHHASGTVETRDAMAHLVVENLAAYFPGQPLLTPVN
jgi:lactate dehydrogenase-like 2-hydroxyacid dehydrogenase